MYELQLPPRIACIDLEGVGDTLIAFSACINGTMHSFYAPLETTANSKGIEANDVYFYAKHIGNLAVALTDFLENSPLTDFAANTNKNIHRVSQRELKLLYIAMMMTCDETYSHGPDFKKLRADCYKDDIPSGLLRSKCHYDLVCVLERMLANAESFHIALRGDGDRSNQVFLSQRDVYEALKQQFSSHYFLPDTPFVHAAPYDTAMLWRCMTILKNKSVVTGAHDVDIGNATAVFQYLQNFKNDSILGYCFVLKEKTAKHPGWQERLLRSATLCCMTQRVDKPWQFIGLNVELPVLDTIQTTAKKCGVDLVHLLNERGGLGGNLSKRNFPKLKEFVENLIQQGLFARVDTQLSPSITTVKKVTRPVPSNAAETHVSFKTCLNDGENCSQYPITSEANRGSAADIINKNLILLSSDEEILEFGNNTCTNVVDVLLTLADVVYRDKSESKGAIKQQTKLCDPEIAGAVYEGIRQEINTLFTDRPVFSGVTGGKTEFTSIDFITHLRRIEPWQTEGYWTSMLDSMKKTSIKDEGEVVPRTSKSLNTSNIKKLENTLAGLLQTMTSSLQEKFDAALQDIKIGKYATHLPEEQRKNFIAITADLWGSSLKQAAFLYTIVCKAKESFSDVIRVDDRGRCLIHNDLAGIVCTHIGMPPNTLDQGTLKKEGDFTVFAIPLRSEQHAFLSQILSNPAEFENSQHTFETIHMLTTRYR